MSTTPAAAFALPPLDNDLREILGRPNFACAGLAATLRKGGMDIPRKAEAEQAAVIYWMLTAYAQHGSKWWQVCYDALTDMQAKATPAGAPQR